MRIGNYTILGRFTQQPNEDIRRLVNAVNWLVEGETILTVTAAIDETTTPPLVIDRIVIGPDGDKFAYYTSGGLDGTEYTVTFTTTTSAGQTREDELLFSIKEIRRG
jgi:hypothetical protein